MLTAEDWARILQRSTCNVHTSPFMGLDTNSRSASIMGILYDVLRLASKPRWSEDLSFQNIAINALKHIVSECSGLV